MKGEKSILSVFRKDEGEGSLGRKKEVSLEEMNP